MDQFDSALPNRPEPALGILMPTSKAVKVRIHMAVPPDRTIYMSRVPCVGEDIKVPVALEDFLKLMDD